MSKLGLQLAYQSELWVQVTGFMELFRFPASPCHHPFIVWCECKLGCGMWLRGRNCDWLWLTLGHFHFNANVLWMLLFMKPSKKAISRWGAQKLQTKSIHEGLQPQQTMRRSRLSVCSSRWVLVAFAGGYLTQMTAGLVTTKLCWRGFGLTHVQ